MRIIVNDIAASEGGALAVLQDFYESVKRYDDKNEYIFLLSDQYIESTEKIKVILLPQIKKSHLKKMIFDFVTGRRLINRLKPDVVFSLQNIITFGVRAKQVVYVHQSIPYQRAEKFSFFKARERKLAFIQYGIGTIINWSVKKSADVIVQTEWMKRAILEKVNVEDKKIHVIPPAVKDIPDAEQKEFNCHAFFYPTSDYSYKNNKLLLDASQILVTAGHTDFMIDLTMDEQKQTDVVKNVRWLGRISRREVFKKYRESTLVFPSYIETYGMPLAEARSVGTIILAADCEYAREVLYGYQNAYFFDYRNAVDLARLMAEVMDGRIKKMPAVENIGKRDGWKVIMELLFDRGRGVTAEGY